MPSFVIDSLFTAISLQQRIDLYVKNLFKDRNHVDRLSKDSFGELLTLGSCLNHSDIIWLWKIWWSSYGFPIKTHIYLCFSLLLLKIMASKLSLWSFKLSSVEGTLMIYSHFLPLNITSKNSKIIQMSTQKHWVYFRERKWKLHIALDKNRFTTSVYCKPTFSWFFTNFKSFILKSCKKNLLLTLLYRAFNLCSSFKAFLSGDW